MDFTIDELVEELLQDKDWELQEPLRSTILKDFGWTIFGF